MIASLRGKIKSVGENFAIIEVGGIGYEVNLVERTAAELSGKKGRDIEVYTHYYLRETAAELYGFLEEAEREMFEILIGISGVGPKGALNVLNAASIDILQRGIAAGDTSVLTKVSGIGTKIAQKIILELKDKFGDEWSELGGDIRADSDAIEALESLGYTKAQAQKALKELPQDLESTEDKVKEALKQLGSK
ncbi:MAG: Holliday junction branch migration protein RuvA [Candidatus Spechtbacterales bacterium]|nr:Holliday junction branch migration protein RuvA [Candidatus Spechtbacterales bacterium]